MVGRAPRSHPLLLLLLTSDAQTPPLRRRKIARGVMAKQWLKTARMPAGFTHAGSRFAGED
jgi:hypothetical protein